LQRKTCGTDVLGFRSVPHRAHLSPAPESRAAPGLWDAPGSVLLGL
jgi:hypothetical protein